MDQETFSDEHLRLLETGCDSRPATKTETLALIAEVRRLRAQIVYIRQVAAELRKAMDRL